VSIPSNFIMVKKVNVQGYNQFRETVDSLSKSSPDSILCFFSGDKDSSGKSWCPDCVTYEPVVRESVESLDDSWTYIYCSVGGRDYWKNRSNEFRTDKDLKLTGVPTLLRWGGQKLAENKLTSDLIQMLLE